MSPFHVLFDIAPLETVMHVGRFMITVLGLIRALTRILFPAAAALRPHNPFFDA